MGRGARWGDREVDRVRYGFTEAGRVWRTFGWLGLWDITEVKVDEFKERYHARFGDLSQSRMAQKERKLYAAMRAKRREDLKTVGQSSDADMHDGVAVPRGTPIHRSGVARRGR